MSPQAPVSSRALSKVGCRPATMTAAYTTTVLVIAWRSFGGRAAKTPSPTCRQARAFSMGWFIAGGTYPIRHTLQRGKPYGQRQRCGNLARVVP